MKIVIIEDETLLAEELSQQILELRPDWQIVKHLFSIKESLAFFSSHDQYDLIFSDIQLGDGLSFQIFEQCTIQAPIIFCTAYSQYGLSAIKNQGIDYILKPFHQSDVLEAIQRFEALKLHFSIPTTTNFTHLLAELNVPNKQEITSLLVRYKDKIIPISTENITLFYLRNGLVYLLDFEQNNYPVNESLDELESKLTHHFYRVDRQHIVNRKAIKDVSQHLARKLAINLKVAFPETLLIRKEKISDFLNWLAKGQ